MHFRGSADVWMPFGSPPHGTLSTPIGVSALPVEGRNRFGWGLHTHLASTAEMAFLAWNLKNMPQLPFGRPSRMEGRLGGRNNYNL